MSEATKYMEEIPHWSEQSETSQSEVDKDAAASPPSPASQGSASSPIPLSIVATTAEWPEGKDVAAPAGEAKDFNMEEGERSDEEYQPTTPTAVGRGQGRRRGRPPKSLSGEQAEPGGSTATRQMAN